MTNEEMIREIETAADAERISRLHYLLPTLDLSREEWLDMERRMHSRMYDGSMIPLPYAPQFAPYV